MSIEDEFAPVSVKRRFQDAALRTGQTSIGEAVAIGIKAAHRFAPWAAGAAIDSIHQMTKGPVFR
jgi:hypothetical protein